MYILVCKKYLWTLKTRAVFTLFTPWVNNIYTPPSTKNITHIILHRFLASPPPKKKYQKLSAQNKYPRFISLKYNPAKDNNKIIWCCIK